MAKAIVSNFCERSCLVANVAAGVAQWQGFPWDIGLGARDMSALVLHKVRFHEDMLIPVSDTSRHVHWLLGARNLAGLTPTSVEFGQPTTYCFSDRGHELLTSGYAVIDPQEVDYASLPGGGLIVPAKTMYLNVFAGTMAVITPIVIELYFSIVELDQSNLLDLVQEMYGYPS